MEIRKRIRRPSHAVMLIITICVLLLAYIFKMNRDISSMLDLETESSPVYEYHFAMVAGGSDNPYWELVSKGAAQKAEELNAVLEITGDQLTDSYTLADRLRMAAASGVDGIAVSPDGSESINQLIRYAVKEKNIPVISLMENDSDSGRSGYIGINSYEQGYAYGSLLSKMNREKEIHKIALLDSGAGRTDENSRHSSNVIYYSLTEYINTYLENDVELSVEHINKASTFNCRRDIQMLLSSEDAPDVLICGDYQFTISACQVVVERNLVGKVQILGSYISEDILNYIQKGTIYGSVAVDPYALGENCIAEMVELKETGRTNDYVALEMQIIDADNVAQYKQQYMGGQEE